MKHTKIKIFTLGTLPSSLETAEQKINEFIQDHVVVEIIPYATYLIVRYKETY